MKINRVCSVLLIFVLLSGMQVFGAEVNNEKQNSESVFEPSAYGESAVVMDRLSLIPESWLKSEDAYVTRAELAELCAKLTGLNNISQNLTFENTFDDVPKNHWAYRYIQFAYSQGYLNGTSENLFMPDGHVSINEAVKVAVSMIGFNQSAAAKGGYPSGYLRVAAEKKLLNNVTNTAGDITRGNIIILFYNTVHADMAIMLHGGSEASYAVYEGRTILTEYLGIKKDEGVVTANYYVSLSGSTCPEKDIIVINGRKYRYDVSDCREIFGKNVEYYYEDSSDSVQKLYYTSEKDNRVITASAEDTEDFKNGAYIINAGKSSNTFRLSVTADIYYNYGRLDGISESLMVPKVGSVTLIDNNNDNRYDVVLIFEQYHLIVERVDTNRGFITDRDETVILSENKDQRSIAVNDYEIFEIVNSRGESVSYETLTSGSLLTVYRSSDNRVLFAELSDRTVSSKMSEKSDGYLLIDGVWYRISGDARFELDFLRVGETYTFGFNSNGEVVLADPISDFAVGYVLGVRDESGISGRLLVKLLDFAGNTEETFFTDKVSVIKIDGKKTVSNSILKDMLASEGDTQSRQLIYYTTNKDGNIDKVVFPYIAQNEQDYENNRDYPIICMQYLMNEWPANLKNGNSVIYKSDTFSFGNWLLTKKETVVFNVPLKDAVDYDDKLVTAGGISSLMTNDEWVEFDGLLPYKITASDVCADVLVRHTDKSAGSQIIEDSAVCVVSEITSAIDPSTEEETCCIKLFNQGNEKVYYTEDENTLRKLGIELNVGDVIKYAVNKQNRIYDVKKFYDRKSKTILNGAESWWGAIFRCTAGTVKSIKGSSMDWELISANPYREHRNLSSLYVYVYNKRNNRVTVGSISDIMPGDTMMIYSRYALNRIAVVYKEG